MEENEKEDKKAEEKNEDKKDEKNDNKKYKKNKAKDLIQNIDNNFKQDSATFLENLKRFDKNKREKEKVPNISNNLNQIKNNEGTEDDFTMNVNETLIDPYPNLDNPFRQNGDYLNLAQNQEQINLLRIIADNLASDN